MLRRLLAPSVVVASLMLSAAGVAGEDPDPAVESAKTHYRQGLSLVDGGDYQGALREFAAAYEASPNVAVLYNIGQAQIALGQTVEAVETLSGYLRESGEKLPDDRRQQVEMQIEQLLRLLSELEVAVDVSGAQVSVDGREIGRTPLSQSVKLPPGVHRIVVTGEDGSVVARAIKLRQGEHQILSVELPSAPDEASPIENLLSSHSTGVPTPSFTRPPENVVNSRLRAALPYTLAGVGAALAGGALAVYLGNRKTYDNWRSGNAALQNETPGSATYRQHAAANNALASSLESANHTIWGLSIASGVLIAAGAALFIVDRRNSDVLDDFSIGPTGARSASARWTYAW